MGSISHVGGTIPQKPDKNITTVSLGNYHIEGFVSALGVANYLGTFDATRYGPICPQNVDVPRKWRDHLYQDIMQSDALPASEFECLNLNIYTPIERGEQPLPVFVWIHGGGWVVGDGGPEYDGNFLVQHSVKLGLPLIYVAFNYRLGYFGFCNSKELKKEAIAEGEVPFANVGLHDQRQALTWVRENIHRFGGDANNVTIAGESAGAWSVLAHLRSNTPLFRRGMIMSAPALAPQSTEDAQRDFDRILTASGLDKPASDDEKLSWLRSLSVDALLRLAPPTVILPSWDPEWFDHRDSSLPLDKVGEFPTWCDGVTVGWTKDESALFGIVHGWDHWSSDMIQKAVRLAISDASLADEILTDYGITTPRQAVEPAVRGLIQFATDATFGSFMEAMRCYSSTPVSIYRFDQIDTVKLNPFYGYAYHALDNAFVCRLPAVAGAGAPEEFRLTADKYSKSICDFVHGNQPWRPYSSSQKIQSFNGSKSGLVDWKGPEQWVRLASTTDREALLRNGARALMSIAPTQLS